MNDAKGKRVDVHSFFGDLLYFLDQCESNDMLAGYEITQAEDVRDAVSELIEADIAFNEAFHAWQANTSDPKTVDAFCAAADVRQAALNRIGGAA